LFGRASQVNSFGSGQFSLHVPPGAEEDSERCSVHSILSPGLRDSASKDNTVRVVNLGELVASKDEEGGASHQFSREPSELSFVFFQPGVVRVSDNGKMVAMSARHHEHSLSKSRIRFSESIKSLGLSVEILEFGSLYWFEHFI
tara:strand:+ start:67 stop:498 length:432 start_codon:yes stop_codon:yes gene_type:complete